MRDFDVAVQSRIHLAIRYDDLDAWQRKTIFDTFLQQAEDRGLVDDMEDLQAWFEDEYMSSRSARLNGHQIRNIVSLALGLARDSGTKLKKQHLRTFSSEALKESAN